MRGCAPPTAVPLAPGTTRAGVYRRLRMVPREHEVRGRALCVVPRLTQLFSCLFCLVRGARTSDWRTACQGLSVARFGSGWRRRRLGLWLRGLLRCAGFLGSRCTVHSPRPPPPPPAGETRSNLRATTAAKHTGTHHSGAHQPLPLPRAWTLPAASHARELDATPPLDLSCHSTPGNMHEETRAPLRECGAPGWYGMTKE